MTVLALAVAAGCAALMGYAIQRGATCTVAAVDELVNQRRGARLQAMLEASAWVAGGLLLARWAGWLPQLPPGYTPGGATVLGAVLLGLGAHVNRACVFGAIARLGSGEWAYAATPLGYLAGCWALARWAPDPGQAMGWTAHAVQAAPPPLLAVPGPLLALAGLLLLARAVSMLRQRRWTPSAATLVIGLTFAALLPLAGAWAYTDALSELARGMAHDSPLRTALFGCLLGGAMLGGWRAGRWKPARPPARAWLRCFIGGAAMALGSTLIPGSNDGLILAGMPLGWAHAWIAFLTMCASIAGALWLQRQLAGPAAAGARPTTSSTPEGQQP